MQWAAALTGFAVALACVALYDRIAQHIKAYRQAYTVRAGTDLGELFLFVAPRQLWPLATLTAGLVAGVMWWATAAVPLSIVVFCVTMRAPVWLVRHLKIRRARRLDTQLPDAARAMAGGLRAGASLLATLRHIAPITPVPLAQEFAVVLRQQRLGMTFNEAIRAFEHRVGSEAVALWAVTLRVGGQTGGQLADTLEQVAKTIQGRLRMAERMRTLTAQGRMQAGIVGALPLVVLVALSVVSPDAMAPLWETNEGWGVLLLLGLLEGAGFWTISRIVRVDL